MDGCYLALDYEESLSLIRKDHYDSSDKNTVEMFEVAVCEDCGELAIVGKILNDRLVRAGTIEEQNVYQTPFDSVFMIMMMLKLPKQKEKKRPKIFIFTSANLVGNCSV